MSFLIRAAANAAISHTIAKREEGELQAEQQLIQSLPGFGETMNTLNSTVNNFPKSATFTPTAPGGKMIPLAQYPVINAVPITDFNAPIQVGGIAVPYLSPDQVEVSYCFAPGHAGLVQGCNGLGPWKIGGIVRVKNRTKAAMNIDRIEVSLE
ncbi:hypothetical protein HDU76_007727, partial [Blyttiomyces sp. JEL0837]